VSGSYALVLRDGGLAGRILNISDPTNIQNVGVLPYEGSKIMARGQVAYIANGTAGLHVVDFSNPANPTLITTLPINAQDIALSPTAPVLYVAAYNSVKVVDLSLSPPQVVNSFPLVGQVYGIGINAAGTLLATAVYNGSGALQFFTINPATPLTPVMAGTTVSGLTGASWVELGGTTALAQTGTHKFFVDAANPNAPVAGPVTPFSPQGNTTKIGNDIVTSIGTGLLRYGGSGLNYTVNAQLPSTSDQRTMVAVNGSRTLALVSGQSTGTFVVDIFAPTSARVVGSLPDPVSGAVIGPVRSLLATSLGVQVVDLRNPALPVVQATIDGAAKNVVMTTDGWAYAAGFTAGVKVLDARGGNVLEGVTVDTPASAQDVALSPDQNYLFVSDFSGGIRVYSVAGSNRSTPVFLSQFTLPQNAVVGKIAVMGNRFFAIGASGLGTVYVYNVSYPVSPSLAPTMSFVQQISSVTSTTAMQPGLGDYLFLARSPDNIDVYQWSPTAARYNQISSLANTTGVTALAAAGDRLFSGEVGVPVAIYDLYHP
jgi:hypothetical protein